MARAADCLRPPSPALFCDTSCAEFPLLLRLHAWALHAAYLPFSFSPVRSRLLAGGFYPRMLTEVSWRSRGAVPGTLSVHLRQELLASVGAVPLWMGLPGGLQPVVGLAADVRARRLDHERWTSLAVRRRFEGASLEVGLEGLTSEPMAAMERKGTGARALRRAGAVMGVHAGGHHSALSIWKDYGALVPGSQPCWRLCPVMVVHGHVRRWLGSSNGPHMDLRWKAEAAVSAQHRASGLVAQLRGHAAWRQVVGGQGKILQVGSFPNADEAAGPVPHVLYEPLRGHEDFARYTAHVFSSELNATVRVGPAFALGAFFAATQLDHLLQPRRDSWLCAAGPVVSARLPFGPSGLTMRVQSALRTGGYEAARWLHLVTVGA